MNVETAYILAAGLGTRLKPLTLERPKPLVEVAGRALIQYALHYAHALGVEKIAINTHHLYPAIQNALGERSQGIELIFCQEDEVRGTGGGLRGMYEAAGKPQGTALILNADALIDIDIQKMAALHHERGGTATLAVKDAADKKKYGLLGSDESEQIFDFAGRTRFKGPYKNERMFCGVHLAEAALFEKLHTGFCGVNEIGYPPLINEGERVFAFDIGEGYFCDVGTPDRLLEANTAFMQREFDHLPNVHSDAAGNLIAESADVALGAQVHGSVLGANTIVGAEVSLHECVVQSGVTVPPGNYTRRIFGMDCVLEG